MITPEYLEELRACRDCPLWTGRKQVVPPGGNLAAKVLLIGEAPGAGEDAAGEPFVGKAGELLNQFLAGSGLRREDLCISNAVKCRPSREGKRGPVNRKPSSRELKACKPWLKREITLLEPAVIVTLGAVPLSIFIGKNPVMAEYHGQPFLSDMVNFSIFPLYHPAAMIYDRGKVQAYEEDLRLLNGFLIAKGIRD
ncbi:MAG: uracil-DNA glycosylase [Clostridiales bacterium]|jgi:DNA polymerase|nr:uracil-DNA glycosylase [Clostridiales bacterium]